MINFSVLVLPPIWFSLEPSSTFKHQPWAPLQQTRRELVARCPKPAWRQLFLTPQDGRQSRIYIDMTPEQKSMIMKISYTLWAMGFLPQKNHSGSRRSAPHTQAANMSVPRLLDPRYLRRFADPLGMCRPQQGTSKEGEPTPKVKGEGWWQKFHCLPLKSVERVGEKDVFSMAPFANSFGWNIF